ncbi:hypothetical protein XF14_16490 [Burkholderia gladioli]|nr:hypothetical protein XF14_16490 [Burkholderia gladioli]
MGPAAKVTADMLRPYSVAYLAGVACDEFKTRTVGLATSRRESVVAVLCDELVEVTFVDMEDQAFADSLCGRVPAKDRPLQKITNWDAGCSGGLFWVMR